MEKIKLEIERKFLVNENWSSPKTGLQCIQGYISADKEKVVRVRIMDHHAWLTIKSLKTNITRMEFEIEAAPDDIHLQHPFGSYDYRLGIADNKISFVRKIEITRQKIDIDEYSEFYTFMRDVEKNDKRNIVFTNVDE